MPKSISALNGQYLNHHIFRVAHTQREAGLEFFGWERRLKPLRPLFHDISFACAAIAAVVAFACYVFLH